MAQIRIEWLTVNPDLYINGVISAQTLDTSVHTKISQPTVRLRRHAGILVCRCRVITGSAYFKPELPSGTNVTESNGLLLTTADTAHGIQLKPAQQLFILPTA